MKLNCIIGIDPGAAGGLAIYIPGSHTKAVKMPKNIAELSDFFKHYSENYTPVVFLEKLSVRPDDVAVGSDGKANMGKIYRVQKMMANYEHLKALIEIYGIPYVMVHPSSWQSKLKLKIKGLEETKSERKKRYAEYASRLYPEVKVTLWNSDALLIMHFGRWALKNDVSWIKSNLPVREHSKLF